MGSNGGSIDDKLTGLSLVERHRSMNDLIQKSDPDVLSPENLHNWTEKTQADQIYIAKLADRTKNAKVLCDIFKTENQMVIAFALKATWFFRGISDSDLINPDYFIKEIFPIASYHTVCRIVSMFGAQLQDENFAQDFYTKILSIYGVDLAIKLLPRCSVEFIRAQILMDNFVVPVSQLHYIYKRDWNLAVEYLIKRLRRDGADTMPQSYFSSTDDYKKMWILFAKDGPKDFLTVYKKYEKEIHVNLGGRPTKRILNLGLDDVIRNPEFYLDFLHLPTLLNTLKAENLENFALNLMPEDSKDFKYSGHLFQILSKFKPAFRVQFLMKIYARKYNGASVVQLPEFVDWSLAEYLPQETRHQWAVTKINNIQPRDHYKEEHFLKYMSPDTAIPRLTALIKTTPDLDVRITLLKAMIDCCKINEDRENLLKVLRYVVQRHRNDQERLRFRFLEHLESSFPLHTLSSEHWAATNEMIEFMCVSKEISNYGREYFLSSYLASYLQFCLDNGLSIDSTIDKFINHNINNINLLVGVPNHEFVIQDAFFAKYKNIIESNPKAASVNGIICKLIKSFQNRSDSQVRSVTECTWLMDVIKKLLEDPDHDLKYVLMLLQKDIKARAMFADMIFVNHCSKELCENFLRHDASVLINRIPFLLDYCLQTYSLPTYVNFFHKIRAYMNKPLVALFEKAIKEHCEKNKDKNAVTTLALSLILDTEKSENMIREYFPTVTKVDLSKHTAEYVNGEIIAKGLIFIEPPVSFETLSRFAIGDYLKFTVPALLSLPFKKSTADTSNFIKQLADKPVSVKKNGLRLAYFLFPRSELLQFYENLWAVEKNASIREVIFQRTFRMLQTESDNEKYKNIWETLKKFAQTFSEEDKQLFRFLFAIWDIKPIIILDYFETSWAILKRLESDKVNVSDKLWRLSSEAQTYKKYFSEEFCQVLIDEYFMLDGKCAVSQNLLTFLAYYILEAQNLVQQKALFAKLVSEKWRAEDSQDSSKMKSMNSFILKCCEVSLEARLNIDPINLLNELSSLLSSRLSFEKVFDIHVVLNSYIKCKEVLGGCDHKQLQTSSPEAHKIFSDFGQKISTYLMETCSHLGNEIYPVFYSAFSAFYTYFLIKFPANVSKPFVDGLIESKYSVCHIMALDLAEKLDSKSQEYIDLMKKIRTDGNNCVQIIMNQKYGTDAGCLKDPSN